MNVFELNSAVAKIKEKAEAGEIEPEALADTLESPLSYHFEFYSVSLI